MEKAEPKKVELLHCGEDAQYKSTWLTVPLYAENDPKEYETVEPGAKGKRKTNDGKKRKTEVPSDELGRDCNGYRHKFRPYMGVIFCSGCGAMKTIPNYNETRFCVENCHKFVAHEAGCIFCVNCGAVHPFT